MTKVVETNAELYRFLVIGKVVFLGKSLYTKSPATENPPQLKKAT